MSPPPAPDPAALAAAGFTAAQANLARAPGETDPAWQFARACFDWAEFASNNTQRAALAQQGIAAARSVVSNAPALAAGHYYLAMNLGQLARTKSLGALPLVSEMEKLFQRARGLDPQFDRAGPDRNLGLLYLEAPGWPASIGNRGRARQHLERAVALSPDHPENRLNLLEARLRWRELEPVPAELKALEELWPRARAQLIGDAWAGSWQDWDRRWARAQQRTTNLLADDD